MFFYDPVLLVAIDLLLLTLTVVCVLYYWGSHDDPELWHKYVDILSNILLPFFILSFEDKEQIIFKLYKASANWVAFYVGLIITNY